MTDAEAYEFAERRKQMVALLETRGISAGAVLQAMGKVRRELFVPQHLMQSAYEDGALPIGKGQTISQPYIVAFMIEMAGVVKESRVLEIGTGSGYSAAVMAEIGAHVISLERHEELARAADRRLRAAGYGTIAIHVADGTAGWPEEAPYDAILVAAAGPHIPEPLRNQLAIGGQLVMPVGAKAGPQSLICLTRVRETEFNSGKIADVVFVPLVGEGGWPR